MVSKYMSGLLRLFPVVLGLAMTVHAQKYRTSSASVPAFQIYENMLKLAEKEDYAKIEKSLSFLDKIFAEEQKKFGINMGKEIKTALGKKQKSAVLKALRRAVFYDIKDIFYAMRKGNQESAKTLKLWLRMAVTDYELLRPVIKNASFKTDEEIVKAFNKGSNILSVEASPLAADKTAKDIDFNALGKVLNGIEEKILIVFPDF